MTSDDAERRRREDPEAILTSLGLKPGMTFVDVGCGGGFYTVPAARIVGLTGRVYGIDINQESLDELKADAEEAGLANITLVRGRGEETAVCQHCADFVFYAAVLHDFDDPAAVLLQARQMLRPAGRVVDLDFKKDASIGPPQWKRFSQEKAVGVIEAAGFEIESTRELGVSYLIVGTPKG